MLHFERIKYIHTVIAGMGPAGLTAALALLLRGHNVTLIDKRDNYTLKQKVTISQKLIENFMALEPKNAYLKKLIRQNGLTSLRKFLTFQLDLLNKICKEGKVNYQGQTIVIIGKMKILRGENKEIIDVDPHAQTITLKNGQQLAFDHIIDATGVKRGIATLLSERSNGKYRITYSSDLPQPQHQGNAIICFNAATKTVMKRPSNTLDDYPIEQFRRNGWEQDIAPIYYVKASQPKNKVYLVSEIPNNLIGTTDPHKVIDFIEPILKRECGLSDKHVNINKKDITFFSTFKIKHEIADIPYVQLGKNGFAIVLGDACMPANFHFGHGVQKSIEDGLNLLNAFNDEGDCHPVMLIKRSQQIRKEVQEHHRVFNQFLAMKKVCSLSESFAYHESVLFEKRPENFLMRYLICLDDTKSDENDYYNQRKHTTLALK